MSLPAPAANPHASDLRRTQFGDLNYTFMVVCAITVALRIWVRVRIQRSFFLDDWMAVITLLLYYLLAASQIAGGARGEGKHIWEISSTELVFDMKMFFIQQYLYSICAIAVRATIVTLLVRVIPKESVRFSQPTRISLYICLIVCTVQNISYMFLNTFSCTPISLFWNRVAPGATGKCRDTSLPYIQAVEGLTAIGAINDIVIALLPGIIVWQMTIPIRSKILAHLLMVLGCVAAVANWIRFAYIIPKPRGPDFFYSGLLIGIWSQAELGIGLFAACAATLRPLVERIPLPAYFQKRSSTNVVASGQNANRMHLKTQSMAQEEPVEGSESAESV